MDIPAAVFREKLKLGESGEEGRDSRGALPKGDAHLTDTVRER